MSVIASKLFALNLVEVPMEGNQRQSVENETGVRIANLEQDIKLLKQHVEAGGKEIPRFSVRESMSSSSSDSLFEETTPVGRALTNGIDINAETKPTAKIQAAIETAGNIHKTKSQDPIAIMTSRIMSIIQSYGQNETNEQKISWLGAVKFGPIIRRHVEANKTIPFVLPAFPWKSINKVEKVLGPLPDLGEELGLGRLSNLCEDVKEVYEPGAYVLITSDGLVYNDLLGIPDIETYRYGAAFRRMSVELGYIDTIKFTRIMNLQGTTSNEDVDEEEYMATVADARKQLVEKWLPSDFDTRAAIENDPDIKLTYCGYMLFLSKDLRHSPITAGTTGRNEYKRAVKRVATDMITRGKAFARLIEDILPEHVRLSIHRSTGLTKLSFPLVPQPGHFSMTPWHCSVAVTCNGDFKTEHAHSVRPHYDLMYKDGQPWCFRDRSEAWDWPGVEFEFFYPRGVRVVARETDKNGERMKLGKEEMKRLERFGRGFKTVIPIGFEI